MAPLELLQWQWEVRFLHEHAARLGFSKEKESLVLLIRFHSITLGAVSGVMQIGRGIAATPESLIAPRQGKWWNEYEGKWVKTKLPDEQKSLEGVPEDDSDILGAVADEIDASIRDGASGGEVKDMAYYDALEVPATAEQSAIKRKYYLLARKYHPDKVGSDDKEAAEKFKEIAEAYQVLSDPELRAKYDKEGKEGLSADKTSAAGAGNPDIDPSLLFAFLFGSDKFYPYIGRLSTATSAVVGDSTKVSLADARKIQKRRVTRIALKLADKINPWVEQKKQMGISELSPAIEDEWKSEVIELSQTSYGHPLVTTIGKVRASFLFSRDFCFPSFLTCSPSRSIKCWLSCSKVPLIVESVSPVSALGLLVSKLLSKRRKMRKIIRWIS